MKKLRFLGLCAVVAIALLQSCNTGGPSPYEAKVKEMYAAFSAGDIPKILDNLDDNVTWIDPGKLGTLYVGTRQGKAAVADFFKALNEQATVTKFEPQEFVSNGKKVTVTGHIEGVGHAPNKPYSSDWIMYWEFNDAGKVIKHQLALNSEAVAQALGVGGAADHSQMVRDFLAGMDANDSVKVFANCTPDFVVYHPNYPTPLGRAEMMKHVRMINSVLSNAHHTMAESVSSANEIASRGTLAGKNTGPFMGTKPTGKDVQIDWLSYSVLDDNGKMKALYVQFNQMAFMSQLGVKMPGGK